ncbi:DNA-directed RNA polymerases I, II, and III subunit RPABC1 [Thelohanellus kitauei]|uniref:DNA-directed RNA polymerases I, II, and III subunit RPABC1 n=1 Tax=Thelohanellus kitauei TaxID=669202 RepID=A0A0C2N5F2_THEKT|nr:DNA-directed RNA polymerases I, II, and III subunit RPABC1 [Thelohanellus kitauei]
MSEDDNVYRLWRIRKTALQLCHDRGYLVSQEELDMDMTKFVSHFTTHPNRKELTIIVAHNDDSKDQMFVFFSDEDRIGIKSLKNYIVKMTQDVVHRCILVIQQALTPTAKQTILEMAPKFIIEYFFEDELMFNILEHELVPEHIVMSQAEKAELLQRYKLKDSQLPRIQITDPVARYFGLQRGQVVKIIRPSETAGRYVTYRIAY